MYFKTFQELDNGRAESPFGHQTYDIPGECPPLQGSPRLCDWGYHFCTADQLINWIDDTICPITAHGKVLKGGDKCCTVGSITIHAPFETWNRKTRRLFVADCAEHVLHIFEAAYPNDDRPRKAIEAARRFERGEIDAEELEAAMDAAYSAYSAASYSAAYYAAYAARAAAYAAYAARAAAYAARVAAAYSADAAAARDKERAWQTDRLWMYLRGEV